MFVWISGLLDISRMWYTKNQRRYFFKIENVNPEIERPTFLV